MKYVGLCGRTRTDTNLIRILAIVPPNNSIAGVISFLFEDVTKFVTIPKHVTTPDGIVRRVFIEIVGLVVDTPALNSVLDVSVHNAIHSCHQCRFARHVETPFGADYTNTYASNCFTSSRRDFATQVHLSRIQLRSTTPMYAVKRSPTVLSHVLRDCKHVLSAVASLIPSSAD